MTASLTVGRAIVANAPKAASLERRYQFGIRSLLIAVVVASVVFAWVGVILRNKWQVSKWTTQLNALGGIPELKSGNIIGVDFNHGLTHESLPQHAVSDGDLVLLSEIESIEWLNLEHTDVSDSGLKHLRKLPNLRLLHLNGTKASSSGVNALRNASPGCELHWDSQPSGVP